MWDQVKLGDSKPERSCYTYTFLVCTHFQFCFGCCVCGGTHVVPCLTNGSTNVVHTERQVYSLVSHTLTGYRASLTDKRFGMLRFLQNGVGCLRMKDRMMTTRLLALVLGALHAAYALDLSAVPMPPLLAPTSGQGVVLDGESSATVWDAKSEPISVDISGSSNLAHDLLHSSSYGRSRVSGRSQVKRLPGTVTLSLSF